MDRCLGRGIWHQHPKVKIKNEILKIWIQITNSHISKRSESQLESNPSFVIRILGQNVFEYSIQIFQVIVSLGPTQSILRFSSKPGKLDMK